MNKKITFLILIFATLLLPTVTSAISIQSIVDSAVMTTLYVISGLVVILWVVTGFLFLTAQGDPGKLGTAKKSLFSAIAGTLLIIIASSAMSLVGQAFGF